MKLTKKSLQCTITGYKVTISLEEPQEVIDYPTELKPKVKPWRGPKDVYNVTTFVSSYGKG